MNGTTTKADDCKIEFQRLFKRIVDELYQEQEDELNQLIENEKIQTKQLERLKKNIESTERTIDAIKRSKEIKRRLVSSKSIETQYCEDDFKPKIVPIIDLNVTIPECKNQVLVTKCKNIENIDKINDLNVKIGPKIDDEVFKIVSNLIETVASNGNFDTYQELNSSKCQKFEEKRTARKGGSTKRMKSSSSDKCSNVCINNGQSINSPSINCIEIVTID